MLATAQHALRICIPGRWMISIAWKCVHVWPESDDRVLFEHGALFLPMQLN